MLNLVALTGWEWVSTIVLVAIPVGIIVCLYEITHPHKKKEDETD